MNDINIGIIGGSGVYKIDQLKIIEEKKIETPFGTPSDNYIIGEIDGIKVAFLARHGRGHAIQPSDLNNRANLYGFKSLGIKYLIGVSAVGSLRKEIEPTHLVFPDQIIDRTKGRAATFFGDGIVAHIEFAEPFCPQLIDIYENAARELDIIYHKNKTYVCMEGPAFSTKAESFFHRQIGGDLIGMTAIPEAKLAREAEICYATIALSTDFDCWHEAEESVNVGMVAENVKKNNATMNKLLVKILPRIGQYDCKCHNALEFSIMTPRDKWPEKTRQKLAAILKDK